MTDVRDDDAVTTRFPTTTHDEKDRGVRPVGKGLRAQLHTADFDHALGHIVSVPRVTDPARPRRFRRILGPEVIPAAWTRLSIMCCAPARRHPRDRNDGSGRFSTLVSRDRSPQATPRVKR